MAEIYSKISQGKELTEEEKKILAAYLEGVRESEEEKEKQEEETEELRDILARAMFNKPADELEKDELRRVHEVAVEIRRLMARQFGATEEGEKGDRLDEIKEEIKSMREKLKEIKKSAIKRLLRKIKKRKVKKKREDKPYTREARARKRAWLRARGRKV